MLISESRFRKILREEARRVLREEADTVGLDMVRAAHKAVFTKTIAGGRKLTSVGGRSPFSDYESNYTAAVKFINDASAAMPDDASAKGSVGSNFARFTKQGSKSPFAPALLRVRTMKASPEGKARAILAILGGYSGSLDDFGNLESSLGIRIRSLGIGLSSGDSERKAIDASFKGDAQRFIDAVVSMANFDVVGETQRVLAGNVEGVPEEMEVSSPDSPAAGPGASAPGKAAPMNWNEYVKVTKGGQEVKNAWDRYALAAIPAINPNDFSEFSKWWKGYKKSNPSWVGSPIETITALGKATASRRASNRAG